MLDETKPCSLRRTPNGLSVCWGGHDGTAGCAWVELVDAGELQAVVAENARLASEVERLRAALREDADRWEAGLPGCRLPGLRRRMAEHIGQLRCLAAGKGGTGQEGSHPSRGPRGGAR